LKKPILRVFNKIEGFRSKFSTKSFWLPPPHNVYHPSSSELYIFYNVSIQPLVPISIILPPTDQKSTFQVISRIVKRIGGNKDKNKKYKDKGFYAPPLSLKKGYSSLYSHGRRH